MDQKEIEQLFKQLDKDDSKSIEKNEFVSGMQRFLGVGSEYENDLQILFTLADSGTLIHEKKGDEKLGPKEFRRFVSCIPQERKDIEKVFGTLFFKMIDSNNSGSISRKEMEEFLHLLGFIKTEN